MMNLILVVFQCCATQYQENAKHTPSHHLGPHSHHVHRSGEGKECIVLPSRGIPLYHTPHHSLHQQIMTGLTERHIKVSLYVKKIVFQLTHAWVMFFWLILQLDYFILSFFTLLIRPISKTTI